MAQHTHADTIVQLIDNSEILIASGVPGDSKGSVVGADFSDVAVLPVAEFGVVVASSSVSDRGRAACCARGHGAVRSARDLRQGIGVGCASDL